MVHRTCFFPVDAHGKRGFASACRRPPLGGSYPLSIATLTVSPGSAGESVAVNCGSDILIRAADRLDDRPGVP